MFRLDQKTKEYTDIYNSYYAMIFNIAYGKTGSVIEAEDISQEVFIRYYEKFSKIREARKWLFGTLRLVLLEHFRKKEKKACHEINDELFFNKINTSPLHGVKDIKLIIKDALESLGSSQDPLEKVIFDLIAVYNYSYRNVASQLGLSRKKVRYRYNKMARELIDYFNKQGIRSLEELVS